MGCQFGKAFPPSYFPPEPYNVDRGIDNRGMAELVAHSYQLTTDLFKSIPFSLFRLRKADASLAQ